MPQLFPNQVDWDLPKQIAEKSIYDAFRAQLPPDYLVFYSAPWQSRNQPSPPKDGEADFLIAHPDHGILVLEVKGGREINVDGERGKWVSIDGRGNTNEIQDPIRQAVRSKHELKRQLATMLNIHEATIPIFHAVAFPGTFASNDLLFRADLSRDIVLDNGDLSDIQAWFDRFWDYYRTQNELPKGLLHNLRQLLGKSFTFRPALWGEFVDETNTMITLTQEQFDTLDALQLHNRALIWGCAGSGKTLIAAEKAVRLARQGFRVLLTCFNKGLAAFLRDRIATHSDAARLPLRIVNYHDLCEELAAQAGIAITNTGDQAYFDEVLPMALMEASEALNVRFDAIIVDEGQDFQNDWWATLFSLLNDPENGIFYIFYDEQQRIYPNTGNFPIPDAPFLLTRNCRNTRNIHRQMLKFYSGAVHLTAQGPQGRPIQLLQPTSSDGLHTALSQLLTHLTSVARVPHHEIVVLTPSRKHSTLWSHPLPGHIQLTDQHPVPPGQIFRTTIHAFKGLEASVVILAELDLWTPGPDRASLESLLYVACSRARNHLIVILPQDAPAALLKHFSK